jgi:hypothetical protein
MPADTDVQAPWLTVFGGDLSEFGLNGRLPTIAEAETLIGAEVH